MIHWHGSSSWPVIKFWQPVSTTRSLKLEAWTHVKIKAPLRLHSEWYNEGHNGHAYYLFLTRGQAFKSSRNSAWIALAPAIGKRSTEYSWKYLSFHHKIIFRLFPSDSRDFWRRQLVPNSVICISFSHVRRLTPLFHPCLLSENWGWFFSTFITLELDPDPEDESFYNENQVNVYEDMMNIEHGYFWDGEFP